MLNPLLDIAGGFAGFFCQRLDFGGDDRKSPSCFSRTRRFDGRVEGKQVGLSRDLRNEFDDRPDLLGRCRESRYGRSRLLDFGDGLARRILGLGGTPGDLAAGGRELFGSACDARDGLAGLAG